MVVSLHTAFDTIIPCTEIHKIIVWDHINTGLYILKDGNPW